MPVPLHAVINGAVEGNLDEAILIRLIEHVGAIAGTIYGKSGKPELLKKLDGYNQAAKHQPWVVMVDLNMGVDCAPPYRADLLPEPAPHMCFRIAVREVEAWLLADRERIAKFLSVARSKIPQDPDSIPDPKLLIVNLARRSRRRDIVADLVPREGSGRPIGSVYTARMIEFATDWERGWRPEAAAETSDSLSRCISCLNGLMNG